MPSVSPAIARSRKNIVPKITPPYGAGGISVRSDVSVTKTIPGPLCVGSIDAWKSVGKMISPAMIAIIVSASVTRTAELVRSSRLEM